MAIQQPGLAEEAKGHSAFEKIVILRGLQG
jgi:hypothetical protein